jgi:mono/diheme cytochrome c family protein
MKKMLMIVAAALPVILVACAPQPETVGKSLYQSYCTACHGPAGQGDGPLAADLDRPVPDLTQIAARNGGTFPTARVMNTIDGYTRVREGNVTMPEFGADLQAGPLVMFDSGDGRPVPTPANLVALAEYLRTLQR